MEYKRISFAERLGNRDLYGKYNCSLCPKITKVNKRVKAVEKGRIVYKSEVVNEDPRSNFEGVTIYDFDIDIMRDAGTLAMLKVGSLQGSAFHNVDNLVGSLASIDSVEE